jgi:hypothetical protein
MCTQAWEIQSISPESEKIWSNFGWSGPASPAAQPSVIPIHDETKPESHIGWTDEKGPNQGVAK